MDDDRSCDGSAFQTVGAATWKLPLAEPCSCRRDKCVVAFCLLHFAGDWDADVVEVGRTVLLDTVKLRDCYFKLYSLWHWQPMKHVAKSRRDVFVSAITDDQTGGSIQDHLLSLPW